MKAGETHGSNLRTINKSFHRRLRVVSFIVMRIHGSRMVRPPMRYVSSMGAGKTIRLCRTPTKVLFLCTERYNRHGTLHPCGCINSFYVHIKLSIFNRRWRDDVEAEVLGCEPKGTRKLKLQKAKRQPSKKARLV